MQYASIKNCLTVTRFNSLIGAYNWHVIRSLQGISCNSFITETLLIAHSTAVYKRQLQVSRVADQIQVQALLAHCENDP